MDLNSLINPNYAYLFLVAGFVLSVMAVLSPGTGLLEIGALFAFVLAGWQIFNLSINWWALVVLVLGVFPFLLAVRFSKKILYLVIAILALVIGSAFLFKGETWLPAVNPFLALITSTIAAGYIWILVTKYLQASTHRPSHDLESLIGQIGETRTPVSDEGSVYVNGELWSATSSQPIPAGMRVKVINRQGLMLLVEPEAPDEA